MKSFLGLSAFAACAVLLCLSGSAHATILAFWTCESTADAAACQSVSVDDVGGGVILYSSVADIPLDPVFADQLHAADSFTFEFNSGDSPPFNGLDNTSIANGDLDGQIVGKITVTNLQDGEIQLDWNSIYTSVPADWQAAGGLPIDGTVELIYDPNANRNGVINTITSLDVILFVPEPGTLWLMAAGLLIFGWGWRRNLRAC